MAAYFAKVPGDEILRDHARAEVEMFVQLTTGLSDYRYAETLALVSDEDALWMEQDIAPGVMRYPYDPHNPWPLSGSPANPKG